MLIWTKRNPEAEAVIPVVDIPAVDIPVEATAIPAEVMEDGAHLDTATATAEALSADLGAVSSAALPDPWGHLVAMDTYVHLAAIDLAISLTGHLADTGIAILFTTLRSTSISRLRAAITGASAGSPDGNRNII